jgi:hypothetical protein
MPRKKALEKVIADEAQKFALQIVKAVKGASLQELIDLRGAKPKRRGRKPGPKLKARKNPGPKPKHRGRKPGPKPKAKKKPGPKPKTKPGRKSGRPKNKVAAKKKASKKRTRGPVAAVKAALKRKK